MNVQAGRAAGGFAALGIGQGDSVAIMLRNDIPFMLASAGASRLGAYPVPINWHLKEEEVNYILKDCEAKALVIHADLLSGIGGAVPPGVTVFSVPTPPEVAAAYGITEAQQQHGVDAVVWEEWLEQQPPKEEQPELQVASMIYTSGTTGRPKGVRRAPSPPERAEANMAIAVKAFGLAPGMRTIIPAPLYHSAPNGYAGLALRMEGLLVLQPRFDAEEFLALIERHKITRIQVVPTMFVRLLRLPEDVRNRYDLSSLEYTIHASAPCPPKIKKAMIDWWGPIVHEFYGSTEVGIITHCDSAEALSHPGTVGRAVEKAIVRIYDDDGAELPTGGIGTVYCRMTTSSDFTYQGDDAKRRSIERDGLITNGDVGYLDDEGFLYLCDRSADMVISGGVNIYPAEIEFVLIEAPGVKDCAVFGIPDEDFGESLAAIIEPDDGVTLDAQEISDFLSERMARYKVPKHIEFRKDLPREDSGKLFKRRLREPFWAKAGRKI
jgi:long-chain acyl-CoA synthetase